MAFCRFSARCFFVRLRLERRSSFAQGRAGNPLIVHVSSMEEAERWGVLCGRARLLARRFWAGGLTLVVPYRGEGFAPRGVVTDMGSIALRVPSHGVALSLLCVVALGCLRVVFGLAG